MIRTIGQFLSPSAFWRRARNTVRTIFTRGDFTTLIITILIMLIPVLSLNASLDITKELGNTPNSWPLSLRQLIPVAILSVVFGFLLARSHYSELLALIMSGIYSIASIGIVQYATTPGNPITRIYNIVTRFIGSFNMAKGSGLDPYLLILFLSVLIWFLGHNTAWHTFRLDRVWRAILPPGVVLMLNSFYNFQQVNLDPYLIIYIFLALLLVVRSHVEAREFDWYMNRVTFNRNLRTWFFRSGALAGIIMLIFAWSMPTGNAEDNAKRFQQFLSGDIVNKVTQLLNKLFGSLEGQGIAAADYYGGDTLTLGGAINLGDQIVMVVKAPQGPRYYWKSRVFDKYEGGQWSSPRGLQITSDQPGLVLRYPPTDPNARKDVNQRFTMVLGASHLVYAAPQPTILGVPAEVDMDYTDSNARTINPSVIRPMTTLEAGDEYTVVSSMVAASAAYLRNTPTDYPVWVKDLDLQLPSNVTDRTRTLARKIVQDANAQNNYDRAKAIERWLRQNLKYNEVMPNPPRDRDLVDWVLFSQKEAYCTYYASSMIVMLRMLGIPARMGAGFAQGIYDANTESYIVRERDAHTWVEVYFPVVGWVEFEPTAAQQTLDRPDSNGPQPTLTPTPSPSPTPSPTPLPTATQGASLPQASPSSQPPEATMTPTAIPTITLSPTPPPPPPPRFLDIPPQVQNLAGLLLVLAGVLTTLSFLAVSLLWWIEYRGLDRLSPVGRAYARLAIYARWLGIPLTEANTPLERGRRISRDVPTGSRPVTSITDMYISERYARPKDVTPDEEKEAVAAWRNARRAFIGRKIRKWLRRG